MCSQTKFRNSKAPRLNAATLAALDRRGAYIGFTSAALVGDKAQQRVSAIREGIEAAGGDPSLLSTVDLLDANKIAQWASRHRGVAVWLREQETRLSLDGYQAVSEWGKRRDIASVPHVVDSAARYRLGQRTRVEEESPSQGDSRLTALQARERISDHLAECAFAEAHRC